MSHKPIESQSVEQTHNIARDIVEQLSPGAVIGLSGPLGAGKSEFVRGVGKALQIAEQIVSPTFVLEQVYQVTSPLQPTITTLHHWDLYRLSEDPHVGYQLEEYLSDSSKLTLVEWPEKIKAVENLLTMQILIDFTGSCEKQSESFSYLEEDNARIISINTRP